MEKKRTALLNNISNDLAIVPICALLGPRQSGKTTLARQFAKSYNAPVHYFDMEDYTDLARMENPKLIFEALSGLIVIDEIQRRPDLFPYLRVVADTRKDIKFLILGSASRDLLQQSSETLAGRIAYISVTPFQLSEVGHQKQLWLRGGFPISFLADSDEQSYRWREIYMQTYFEKDLANLGLNLPPHRILKLWAMLAQYHGNILNYSNMAQFLEVSTSTLKNYLALLEGTFMIRILPPWHENRSKRLVKSPKLYIRDSGIYHNLQSIKNYQNLILDTQKGASWEGFGLEEVINALQLRNEECYFWATHQMAEVDLFVTLDRYRIGFEFKCSDQPQITKSMRSGIESLDLHHLFIVTPVEESFPMEKKISVLALKDCSRENVLNF
jgi:predicted AAA+ superfamily ATPase